MKKYYTHGLHLLCVVATITAQQNECRFDGGTLETSWTITGSSFNQRYWKFNDTINAPIEMMSIVFGTVTTDPRYIGRITQSPSHNAGMILTNISPADSGYYSVEAFNGPNLIYSNHTPNLQFVKQDISSIQSNCRLEMKSNTFKLGEEVKYSKREDAESWGITCENTESCMPSGDIFLQLRKSNGDIENKPCPDTTSCEMNVTKNEINGCVSFAYTLNYTALSLTEETLCICYDQTEKVIYTAVSCVIGVVLSLAVILAVVLANMERRLQKILLGVTLVANVIIFIVPIIVASVSVGCLEPVIVIVDTVVLAVCLVGIGITWGVCVCKGN